MKKTLATLTLLMAAGTASAVTVTDSQTAAMQIYNNSELMVEITGYSIHGYVPESAQLYVVKLKDGRGNQWEPDQTAISLKPNGSTCGKVDGTDLYVGLAGATTCSAKNTIKVVPANNSSFELSDDQPFAGEVMYTNKSKLDAYGSSAFLTLIASEGNKYEVGSYKMTASAVKLID